METSVPAMKVHYEQEVIPALRKAFGYKNRHQIPVMEKIILNSALNADSEKSWIAEVEKDVALIAAQKPVVTRAKKSISNFKLRKGMPNGVKVTLRGRGMYEFWSRLIHIALPVSRDFRGLSNRFDGRGNYTFGIVDHTIFPEISIDHDRKKNVGMDVTVVTSARTDAEALEFLKLMGAPFRLK
jgi:large subunit ribosomal protein L5